jgi:hypothetical protein
MAPDPQPELQNSPSPFSVIAQNLNIYTLQGLATSQDTFIVPTLDGVLLQINPKGEQTTLVDLLKAELGVPFGIIERNGELIVTVSGYLPVHYLVKVKLNGTFTTLADLSKASGFYGAPFGIAEYQGDYFLTVSTDVVSSTSALMRVSATGGLTKVADLSQYGIPFSVATYQDQLVVAQEKGHLLRITPAGQITEWVNLQTAGLGIPLGLTVNQDELIVTTNSGAVVGVNAQGVPGTIADLAKAKLGIPSGVVIQRGQIVVTTNQGYLLQIARTDPKKAG